MDENEKATARLFAEEWIHNLANAVVRQASLCYKVAKNFEKRHPELSKAVTDDCDAFFCSWWYDMLTGVPRGRIVNELADTNWSERVEKGEIGDDEKRAFTFDNLKRICRDACDEEKAEALIFYDARVKPRLDDILSDLRRGKHMYVVIRSHDLTSHRWDLCRKIVPGFKEATDDAIAAGENARPAKMSEQREEAMKIMKEKRDEIERNLAAGKARTTIARDLGVSRYRLDEFLGGEDAVENGRKMTSDETEKYLAANLPYIRSRLDAGETRTAIAKSLGVSFYRLRTFLEADGEKTDESAETADTLESEASSERERTERAKLDAIRREEKKRLLEDLCGEGEGLPEGVAAQRLKKAEEEPKKEDEEDEKP